MESNLQHLSYKESFWQRQLDCFTIFTRNFNEPYHKLHNIYDLLSFSLVFIHIMNIIYFMYIISVCVRKCVYVCVCVCDFCFFSFFWFILCDHHMLILTSWYCMTSFDYGGKKAGDVGITYRCHLSNIMPHSIFYDIM